MVLFRGLRSLGSSGLRGAFTGKDIENRHLQFQRNYCKRKTSSSCSPENNKNVMNN